MESSPESLTTLPVEPNPTSSQIPEPDERWDRFIASLLDGRSIKHALRLADTNWAWAMRRMQKYPAAESEYLRAREGAADIWADKAIRHTQLATPENAHAQRLKFDGARWQAATRAPRKWSEKQGDTNVNVNLSLNSVHLSMLRHREPVNSGLVEALYVAPSLVTHKGDDGDISEGARGRAVVAGEPGRRSPPLLTDRGGGGA